MMMTLLGFTIVVICGVVTSQNHDVNLQTPFREMTRKRSVEATTLVPPDPKITDEGIQILLTRLENLCVEKLEYLITDTNIRFETLENRLSQCSMQNIGNLEAKVENVGKNIQELMSQGSSCPASPVVQNIENLEVKVENLRKEFHENIQELMDATRNVPSDVQAIKRNVSSLINVTRSFVDLSSNSELKQIFNKGLQELKDLQNATSTSFPLNFTVDKQYPRNCREVRENKKTAFGTYMIQPEHAPKPFQVVCDLKTRGGGWTVIQRRFDGSQDFFRNWEDYKNGFGHLGGEFWLGLEHIHLLTGYEENELLIEIGDFESQNRSAFYTQFTIGSELEAYSLKVLGTYSGDCGDSLVWVAGMKFTTKDKDQDYSPNNCAEIFTGAWWYNGCSYSNLNGKYFNRGEVPPSDRQTIFWYYFKNEYSGLKHTRMLVRPKV